MRDNPDNYVSTVLDSAPQLDAREWNGLLGRQAQPSPFMRHEYLAALEHSASATPATGWTPRFLTLMRGSSCRRPAPCI